MSDGAPDPKDVHRREQLETAAVEAAHQCAVFYATLRKRGVPATAASAMAEAYTAALVAGDIPREPWQS